MTHCRRTALALVVLLIPGSVLAHDWYPLSCCSEKDSRPLIEANGETVLESPRGRQLWDGRTVPRGFAKASPDRQFHLCETMTHTVICFFAPPGGS